MFLVSDSKVELHLNKGKLQSTHIPEDKWTDISVGFITDLPVTYRNKESTLVAVDKATRMVYLALCSKKCHWY